jgi:hypothetical protein
MVRSVAPEPGPLRALPFADASRHRRRCSSNAGVAGAAGSIILAIEASHFDVQPGFSPTLARSRILEVLRQKTIGGFVRVDAGPRLGAQRVVEAAFQPAQRELAHLMREGIAPAL